MNADELLSSGNIKRIHMTGIGGVSMSGLARILSYQGYIVTGSDERPSPSTQKLEKEGIKVTIGHFAENVDGADLLVYTAAVKPDNIELVTASGAGIPCITRATLLGENMKKYSMSFEFPELTQNHDHIKLSMIMRRRVWTRRSISEATLRNRREYKDRRQRIFCDRSR